MRNRRCRSLLALGSLPFFVLAGATAVAGAGPAAGATVSNWMISSHAINLINGYTGSGTLAAASSGSSTRPPHRREQ